MIGQIADIGTNYHTVHQSDCNCIVTRGGVYDEILPDPEGNPEG